MFEGWKGFISTANQLWDQMVKWQPTKKTTIDGKEVEIPKYFEIEDDKFGKIVFGEESFQGDMMKAEKQILEGTAAIKTLESIYADAKLLPFVLDSYTQSHSLTMNYFLAKN